MRVVYQWPVAGPPRREPLPPDNPSLLTCPYCRNAADFEVYSRGTVFCPVCAKTFQLRDTSRESA